MRWLPLLGLVGCIGGPPSGKVDWASYLTETGGCGDAEFYAMTPEHTVLVHVGIGGLAADAIAKGQATEYQFDLPQTNLVAELAFGSDLDLVLCGGDPTAAKVDYVYEATAGSLQTDATPMDDGTVLGELLFQNVVFTDANDANSDPITFDGTRIQGTLTP